MFLDGIIGAKVVAPFDPYKEIADLPPGRNIYRRGLARAVRQAEAAYQEELSKASRGEVIYSEAVKRALTRYDQTISDYKCRYQESHGSDYQEPQPASES